MRRVSINDQDTLYDSGDRKDSTVRTNSMSSHPGSMECSDLLFKTTVSSLRMNSILIDPLRRSVFLVGWWKKVKNPLSGCKESCWKRPVWPVHFISDWPLGKILTVSCKMSHSTLLLMQRRCRSHILSRVRNSNLHHFPSRNFSISSLSHASDMSVSQTTCSDNTSFPGNRKNWKQFYLAHNAYAEK